MSVVQDELEFEWWEEFLEGVILKWKLVDAEPNFLYCSKEIYNLLGILPETVIQTPSKLYEIIPLNLFLPLDEKKTWSWKGLVEAKNIQIPIHFLCKQKNDSFVAIIRRIDLSWTQTEEKERLKAVLDSISNYQFFGLDLQYRFTFFSQSFGSKIRSLYFRYPKIGESFLDYSQISLQKKYLELLEKAKLGETIQEEISYLRNGKVITFLLKLSPILSESGFVKEIIGIIEESALENSLAYISNRDFIKTILSSISDIIWSASLEWDENILFVSDNITKVFGFTPEEIYSRSNQWTSNIHPEDLEKFYESRTKILEKDFTEVTYRIKDKSGIEHVVHDRLWVARDSQDRAIRIDGITSDITERSKIVEEKSRIESIISGITKASPDIIYIYDIVERKNVYSNDRLFDILGYTPEEIQVQESGFVEGLIHPEDRAFVIATAIERAQSKEDKIYEFNYRMKAKDGQYRWIESKEVVFKRNKEGYITQILGFARDITERKLAEEKIILNERQMKFAQELAHLGSWDLDISSEMIRWSEEVFRIFELETQPREVHLNEINKIFPSEFVNFFLQQVQTTKEFGTIQKNEVKVFFNEVKTKYIISAMHPLKNSLGQVTKIYGSFLDITQQKIMQEELIFAKERAEAAAKAKSQFLSTMSHEIRTPLNGVIGMTNLLLEEAKDPDIRKNLEILKFSGETLLSLVNDILDLNKIDSENVEIENLEFNLNFLASNIISLYQSKAREKNIDLKLEIDGLLPQILGDPYRLTQILGNLVSNAIKFTNQGSVTLKISVKRQNEKEITILFEVIDTGIGIPKDKQGLVFELFMQAESHTTRLYGGTGLGLAIVKKLVELMKSEIQLESEVGVGSRFFFEITFAKGESIVEVEDTKPKVEKSRNLEGKKILLVEDNSVNVSVAIRFLKKWGLVVDVAENGKVAVEKVSSNDYSLVLMDLQMPVMDGFEATRQIRSMPKSKDLPIIALSADALRETKEKVFRYSMNDYVVKPFNPDLMKEKIIEHIL